MICQLDILLFLVLSEPKATNNFVPWDLNSVSNKGVQRDLSFEEPYLEANSSKLRKNFNSTLFYYFYHYPFNIHKEGNCIMQKTLKFVLMILMFLLMAGFSFAVEFSMAELFLVEGEEYLCDDDWLYSHNRHGDVLVNGNVMAVFSFNEYDALNFVLKFQVIDPQGNAYWSDGIEVNSSYVCKAFSFSAMDKGRYDIFVYVNDNKHDHISFYLESE